jgi:hypothetical protein
MSINRKNLYTGMEYCERISPFVMLDESFHCQVCHVMKETKSPAAFHSSYLLKFKEQRNGAFADLEYVCVLL